MIKEQIFLKTDRLSGLLNLALDDFELINKDSNYKINMRIWHHQYREREPCRVGLGGSILAKTFHYPLNKTIGSYSRIGFASANIKGTLISDTINKLQAIDYIRQGELVLALDHLNFKAEAKAVREIIAIANADDDDEFDDVELILGEDWRDFKYTQGCRNFDFFILFYRRIASKLFEIGL